MSKGFKRKRTINPELLSSMSDLMTQVRFAAEDRDNNRPNWQKSTRCVQRVLESSCAGYQRCVKEDWCTMCSSGQDGNKPRMGVLCGGCRVYDPQTELTEAEKAGHSIIPLHVLARIAPQKEAA